MLLLTFLLSRIYDISMELLQLKIYAALELLIQKVIT